LDERESDLRAILNFGHTIGHAVESVSGFSLLHGECVSIGIAAAYKLAQYLGMVNEHTVAMVLNTLQKAGLPVKATDMDADKIFNQMFHDKKMKNNKLVFVLPKALGEVIQCNVENEELVKQVLEEIVQ
jgi:3-dehydroquinate synthase